MGSHWTETKDGIAYLLAPGHNTDIETSKEMELSAALKTFHWVYYYDIQNLAQNLFISENVPDREQTIWFGAGCD